MQTIHPVWLVIASLALGLVPVAAVLCTCYLKISVVLGMLRSGLGAQQVPGAVVVMGLSLAISGYVMGPVIESVFEEAARLPAAKLQLAPTLEKLRELSPVLSPVREFLERHAGPRELAVLQGAEIGPPRVTTLLAAFMLTEIKEAFSMGFILLLPFLVIDLIVANLLVGMGMYMVSPVMISLPLKLLLFVSADGWMILTRSLIESYV